MMNKYPLMLLIGTLLLINSCATARFNTAIQKHTDNLKAVLGPEFSVEQKTDAIGMTLVEVLEESLEISSVKKSVNYMTSFGKQNEKIIDQLLSEIGSTNGDMEGLEQGLFLLKMGQKDYVKKLIQLIPKFEKKVNRKVKTFNFMSNIFKFLKLEKILNLVGAIE